MHQFYPYLHPDAKWIREEVFVKEQGFEEEFDPIDETCMHLVYYIGEHAAACGRFYPGQIEGCWALGRIAVLPAYRGSHTGSRVLELLEEEAKERGAVSCQLSAQVRAKRFYEKQGYRAVGEPYYEEFCEHILMVKDMRPLF